MALKSSREGLRKELVDYLGNLIIDDKLRNEIIKSVSGMFITTETLNEAVNNLTMQITTETGERIEADDTLQNNINTETTARQEADNTLQKNINDEATARQEAITNLESLIGNGDLKIDLLWTNATPANNFAVQTINLDLSGYDLLLIECYDYKLLRRLYLNVVKKGVQSTIVAFFDYVYHRTVEANDERIAFGDGGIIASSGFETGDGYLIPYRIYGVK